jgi:energy-coupling factor transport system permease protein
MAFVISVVAILWESPLMQLGMALLVTATCLLVGVRWSYIRTVLVIMLPFYLILLTSHALFDRELVVNLQGYASTDNLTRIFTLPEEWPLIGGLYATWDGFMYGLNVVLKTITLFLVIPLVVFTTDINQMLVSLVHMKVPYKVAFIFSSTLRFFPLMVSEFQSIVEAQRLRGLAVDQMPLLKRIRVYSRVAIPLVLGSLVRSQQMEVVLQSKSFSGDPNRTFLHSSRLNFADYALIIFCTLFLVSALILWTVAGVGSFGSFI